eukprot:10822771-Alexandrium_andersonii.AAC.1
MLFGLRGIGFSAHKRPVCFHAFRPPVALLVASIGLSAQNGSECPGRELPGWSSPPPHLRR